MSNPDSSNGEPIRAFAFDAYGTLFDVFSVTSLCEELFPGYGAGLAVTWRAKQLQYSLLRSIMNRYKDFWQVTQDALVYAANASKLDLTAAARARLMDAYLSLAAFPDVRPGLEQLKNMGVRLAILSNGAPAMLEAATRHSGIASLLDAIVSVDDVKVFKPSPEVYRLASSHLDLPASGIGFVSSNSWDINGAGASGLTTFWIQRVTAEPQDELGYPAAHVVRAITDLPALVRR